MSSSMADPNGSSSDNESWTILDEDEHEADRVVTLNTRIDVIKATAQFSKRELEGKIIFNYIHKYLHSRST